jgi:hypothetical protein
MDKDRKILTENMRKIPSTGIRAVDDVHNFIWDLRIKGKPCQSIKLKPAHYSMYVFWVSKQVGAGNIYDEKGVVAAPITCDGVGIELGSASQFAYILPNYLPMDNKTADKYRQFKDDHGVMPEHHTQIN